MRNPCVFAAVAICAGAIALAQVPDHPIIMQVYNNPPGASDGPTGRDASNAHQEYIQLYLPTAAQLRAGLNKDSLKLTFYEIEGDSNNSHRGQVNIRIDLLPFDLDPSNGTTPGAVARPSNGIVIIGWVDYNSGNPPTDLKGTPSTRRGLINGTIQSSPAGTVFVAVNGAQFTGTTNFPVPQTVSVIDVPNENADGFLTDGSIIYLLCNRDDPGYVSLADFGHPEQGPANPSLPSGTTLQLTCVFDALAGNDDTKFDVSAQPYVAPTGLNIDLEDVLPTGGAFSNWVPQVAESSGNGYVRRFVDQRKTTEDSVAGNESPAFDAENSYVSMKQDGPFFPLPTNIVFTSSPPKLTIANAVRHQFSVIAGTTGRPGLFSANTGGNFPINVAVTPGASSNPSVAAFASDAAAVGVPGMTECFPRIAVSVPSNAADGAIVTAPLSFVGSNTHAGDPAVQTPTAASTAQATVINATQGLNSAGQPFEATVYAAVQGFGADPNIANGFVGSTLANFINSHLGQEAQPALGHSSTLLNPATNLTDLATVSPMISLFPASTAEFINATSPAGTADLAFKVANSAKRISGSTTYDASLNANNTSVKAIEVSIPETSTSGGTFATSEYLFFCDAGGGGIGQLSSGLSYATTSRTFELAIVETNVTAAGIESGDGDDFGIVVQVGQVRAGATVLPGQFVFLSYAGGLEGEDLDSTDVPGVNATNAILLDLDNLDAVLGAKTITRLFLIDGGGSSELDPLEVYSLAATTPITSPCPGDVNGDRKVDLSDLAQLLGHFGLAGGATIRDGDLTGDGNVDLSDLGLLLSLFGAVCP